MLSSFAKKQRIGIVRTLLYKLRRRTQRFTEQVRLLEGGGYGRAPASARRLLDVLPPSNWLSRNKQIQKGDLQHFGDSGVWDLLLHHCDRSYRVPDLVRLTHAAGLKVLSFANPNAYELPDTLGTVDTPKDSAADSELDSLRQAAAELEPLAQVCVCSAALCSINLSVSSSLAKNFEIAARFSLFMHSLLIQESSVVPPLPGIACGTYAWEHWQACVLCR